MTYWPTSVKEVITCFPPLTTMEYTVDKIENKITLSLSLLKLFSMFQMNFWYDN